MMAVLIMAVVAAGVCAYRAADAFASELERAYHARPFDWDDDE